MAGLPPYRAGDSPDVLRQRMVDAAVPRMDAVRLRSMTDEDVINTYQMVQPQLAAEGYGGGDSTTMYVVGGVVAAGVAWWLWRRHGKT